MKSVAIITRTKDRPILLRRAYNSVADQTFKNFVWVIVNDGGAPGEVEKTVALARSAGMDVQLINHAESLGMEAASNAGIDSSESEYVVIHDDDDSWDPVFLETTVAYLESDRATEDTMGVVTRTRQITEVIRNDEIKLLHQRSYHSGLTLLTLSDMLFLEKVPPPISFLYRRRLLAEVGSYDSNLPVLGDWDFLIRVLSRYHVGVIEQGLANYHLRPAISFGAYGNSIIAGKNVHQVWYQYITDKYIKQDIESGTVGLGHMLLQGKAVRAIDDQLYVVRVATNLVRMARQSLMNFYLNIRSRF